MSDRYNCSITHVPILNTACLTYIIVPLLNTACLTDIIGMRQILNVDLHESHTHTSAHRHRIKKNLQDFIFPIHTGNTYLYMKHMGIVIKMFFLKLEDTTKHHLYQ
jgi:hypothetical protein